MIRATLAEAFGEKEFALEYSKGAARIKESMNRYFYLEKEKRFARMIHYKEDDSIEVDATIDSSLYGIFAFGMFSVGDERVKNTMEQVRSALWNSQSGGLARYEDDSFYRTNHGKTGNPWFVTTLWLAQYYIALTKEKKDLDKALELLLWVADHALPSGVLSEQLDPFSGEQVSVSPLTWSHGTYIAVVQEYLNKLLEIEKCPTCGLSKIAKTLCNH